MNAKLLILLSASVLALSACKDEAPATPADGPETDAVVEHVDAANADNTSSPNLAPLDPVIAAEAAQAEASVPRAAAVADDVLSDAAIEKAIQEQARLAEEQAGEDTTPR